MILEKETALFQKDKIATDITEAGGKASKYISSDSTGIMVYDGESGEQTPSAVRATTNNVFIDDNSVDVRKGTTILASFGTEAVIKSTDGTELVHFGYDSGQAEIGTSIKPYYTLGTREADSAIGNYSIAEGYNNSAKGYCSHAEGVGNVARGKGAHAEGAGTYAGVLGSSSYQSSEGEGAHAEGHNTVASKSGSHAEGAECQALAFNSHAEGVGCYAKGQGSHAQNMRTNAEMYGQTTLGTYNVLDTSPTTAVHPNGSTLYGHYAVIIGNGTAENARSNALTIGWDGSIRATTETISISASDFTVTTGSISSVSMMRFGNVVQLVMTVTRSSTTSPGDDMFVGTLNLTDYRPKMTTECGSYSGTIALVGRMQTNGTINVNVTGAQLAANRSPVLSFTYLI